MSRNVYILPSLLAGDFGNLRASALMAQEAGGDALHIDIMDAHFVPNLSMGPDVVDMARKAVTIPLSVHLMMERPDKYIKQFAEAGADTLFIHVEASCDIRDTLEQITKLGVKPGLVTNPETPAKKTFPFIEYTSEILCMSVHPGFGGQSFIESVLPKISAIYKEWLKIEDQGRGNTDQKKSQSEIMIAVDGGINRETAVKVAKAGANVIIAGSSLYRVPSMRDEIAIIRKSVQEALP